MRTSLDLRITFKPETGAASDIVSDNGVILTEGGRPLHICGAVDCYNRSTDGDSDVHQTAVITYEHVTEFYQRRYLPDSSPARRDLDPLAKSLDQTFDHRKLSG